MNKKEADMTTRINKWFPIIVPQSSPWEVKHTRGANTFNLNEIAEHQYDNLLASTTQEGCTYKIPDFGPSFPPFDVLHYKNTPAYVIIVFPSVTYVLEIRDIMQYIEDNGKSLPEEHADMLSLWTCKNVRLPQ